MPELAIVVDILFYELFTDLSILTNILQCFSDLLYNFLLEMTTSVFKKLLLIVANVMKMIQSDDSINIRMKIF